MNDKYQVGLESKVGNSKNPLKAKGKQCDGVLDKDRSAGANLAMFDLTWN